MDEQDEALTARAQARLGTTLRGKYRLDRVLGIGGMATVYAATHRNQAELAVKVLHPELSLRDDLRKRFLREGYVGNSVKHPGAVLVVDDDIAEDGSAFLVMELLRGRSLEQLWDRSDRKLATSTVVSLTLQLLDVLAAAHEKAIVHRDLKPANLFLTVDGTLKVLDFGIARLRDAVGGSEHATRTGTLMGTPAFMAPEQAQAVVAEIDGQTDLWAAGATMYTLLSGKLVHDGDNSSQLLIRAGTSRARPLRTVAPDVEPAIAEVFDRALMFEKSWRWPNAMAMREALHSAAASAFGKAPGRDVLASLLELAAVSQHVDSSAVTMQGGGPGAPPPFVVGGSGSTGPTTPEVRVLPSSQGRVVSGAPPALPGLSTGNPVSAEAALGAPPKRSVPLSTAIGLFLALAFLFVGGAYVIRAQPTTSSGATHSPAAPPSPPSLPAPQPSAAAPTVSSAPPPPPQVETQALTSSAAPAAAPPPATPPPPAAFPIAPASVKTSKATPAAQKPAEPDCTTPYTLDSAGDKHWRKECL